MCERLKTRVPHARYTCIFFIELTPEQKTSQMFWEQLRNYLKQERSKYNQHHH